MAVPRIEFTDDSASVVDCVAWATKSIVQGSLTEEARADIPATTLVLARVTHEVTKRAFPQVYGEQPPSEADEHFAVLAAECGAISPLEAAADAQAPKIGINWLILLRLIAELLANME